MKKQAGSWMAMVMLCTMPSGWASSDQVFTWEKVFENEPLPMGAELLSKTIGMDRMLRIRGTEGANTTVRLLTIDEPAVTSTVYAVVGRMAYTNVKGDGYLEMWNVFPGGGRYFSRTMGEPGTGEMAKISGTSPERPFTLPFNRTGVDEAPKQLEINLVLPSAGEVIVGPLTLKEIDASSLMGPNQDAGGRQSAWIFGVLIPVVAVAIVVLSFVRRRAG